MNSQDFMISYIVLHIIPAPEWANLSFRNKKKFHFLITVGGKSFPVKPLDPVTGVIEVVFVGTERYAKGSKALFNLLLDLHKIHEKAKIVHADDLYHRSPKVPIMNGVNWLFQHMPAWLQRKLPTHGSFSTLLSLFSFTL